MKKLALYSIIALFLTGCGTIADHQTVLMTVKTPGAENAKCLLENKDYKYVAYSNETIRVMKTPYDMVVRCTAPGNREKTILVKRELNEWVFVNVANGFVPGATYDYFSRGAFDYPNTVIVDFAGVNVKPYPLPGYESDDLYRENIRGKIEYMGPTEQITEENKYDTQKPLQKIENTYSQSPAPYNNSFESRTTLKGNSGRPRISYDPTEEDK